MRVFCNDFAVYSPVCHYHIPPPSSFSPHGQRCFTWPCKSPVTSWSRWRSPFLHGCAYSLDSCNSALGVSPLLPSDSPYCTHFVEFRNPRGTDRCRSWDGAVGVGDLCVQEGILWGRVYIPRSVRSGIGNNEGLSEGLSEGLLRAWIGQFPCT